MVIFQIASPTMGKDCLLLKKCLSLITQQNTEQNITERSYLRFSYAIY